jgi:hypothetical protein
LELCSEDSDGDGYTNGEELGDPCCTWEENGLPSAYTYSFDPTHPGVAASKPPDSYKAPQCDSTDMEMNENPVVINAFNKGEEQRSMEFRIDDYEIPAKKTTYVSFAFNFDDDEYDLYHLVFAEAIVATPEHLHHYIINGCSEKFPSEMVGKVIGQEQEMCSKQFGGWSPGRDVVSTPPWAGMEIGKDAGLVSFVVNFHFDNQPKLSGVRANDGFRLFYTPTLRDDTLSEVYIMLTTAVPAMIIPPHRSRYFMTRTCTLEVTDEEGAPAEANIFLVGFHAHLLGREMYSTLFRPEGEIDLGSASTWHFDDQGSTSLLHRNLHFQSGDVVQATCVFDSTGRNTDTVIGYETTDEMCWQYFITWPGNVKARCAADDILWMGELAPGEPVTHIATEHPYTEATSYWQDFRKGKRKRKRKGKDKKGKERHIERAAPANGIEERRRLGSLWKETKLTGELYHPPLESTPASQSSLSCKALEMNSSAIAPAMEMNNSAIAPATSRAALLAGALVVCACFFL